MKIFIVSLMMAMLTILHINANFGCPKFPTPDLKQFPKFSIIKNKSFDPLDVEEAKVIIESFQREYERFRKDIAKYKQSLVYFDCVDKESSMHLISYEFLMLSEYETESVVTYIEFKSSLYSIIEFINEFYDYVNKYWEYLDVLDELL